MKAGVKGKATLDHNLKLNDAVINDEFVNYINTNQTQSENIIKCLKI